MAREFTLESENRIQNGSNARSENNTQDPLHPKTAGTKTSSGCFSFTGRKASRTKNRTEKKAKTGSSISVIAYMLETAGKAKYGIAALLCIQMLQALAGIAHALFLRNIINAAVARQTSGFWIAVASLAGLFAFRLLLAAGRRGADAATRSSLENRFKTRLLSALLTQDYGVVSSLHSAQWLNRMSSDTSIVAGGLCDILPGLAGMVVKLIGAVSMIVILEPRFLYLLVPGGFILILSSSLFRKKMKALHKLIQERDGLLRVYLQDVMGSLLMVRSYAAREITLEQAGKRMAEHHASKMKRSHFSNLANLGFGFVMQGASVLGAVFCGYGILSGSMDYGSFTAVLNLIGQIQSPFANISGFMPQYYALLASAERLMEAETIKDMDAVPEPLSLDEVLEAYSSHLEGFGLCQAAFRYPQRGQKLQNPLQLEERSPLPEKLDLFIHKGEYAAFTGPSGCGKSTVLKLLMCLYPLEQGKRTAVMDGKEIELSAAWQRLFAYVPQGNHLMSGTIRDIVAYADPQARHDEKRMEDALTIACARFVYDLEQGLDTILGERGTGLSEGQMQRIAIARAVFSRHPVLMLDECTSALDEETEKQLLSNLRQMTEKTVLIITHRKAALEICDTIMEFSQDQIQIRPARCIS